MIHYQQNAGNRTKRSKKGMRIRTCKRKRSKKGMRIRTCKRKRSRKCKRSRKKDELHL